MRKLSVFSLLIFVFGGICFRWLIDVGDILLQDINNKQTVSATKTQLELNKLVGSETEEPIEQVETAVMGFQIYDEEEYYEDDDIEYE